LTDLLYTPECLRTDLVRYPDRNALNKLLPGKTFTAGDYRSGRADQAGLDLEDIDFSGSTWLPGSRITEAKAFRSKWDQAYLDGVVIDQSDFRGTSFVLTQLVNCTITQSQLGENSQWQHGLMRTSKLAQVDAQHSSWFHWSFLASTLKGINFSHSRFEYCFFNGAILQEINFTGCIFHACNFMLTDTMEDINFQESIDINGTSKYRAQDYQHIVAWPVKRYQ